ncbi:TonB-dependent receptor [Hyphomicrobium sp. CS1GBMeth3]|uniref:TonB-dependent receptor n=1 Tax=Hyphomicrobium sp. CS1GBMeth3 TaxID=1892845 RepID=UPI00092FFDEA|nr:TonB-dependent receptor [Hyphomicrobium sp. CS1GBMeth3]
MSSFKFSVSAFALIAATAFAPSAFAQDAQEASQEVSSESVELPGVIVEAAPAKRNVRKAKLRKSAPQQASQPVLDQQVVQGEKFLRTVRDTTTSVGIVTGQEIEDRQIRDMKEAIRQTANVVTTDNSTGFAVRGLNSEGQTGLQHISGVPLIGVVIDGVTQNPDAVRRGARALWDVEQVEVLRGPQSTLQGRNALGGTVVVKTNDPTYKLGAVVEGTIGTNDLYGTGFVVNSPIVARQSAFRISGYKTGTEKGIDFADARNHPMGEDEYSTLRGKLLIEPDSLPGFSALFTIAHTEDAPGSAQVSGPNFFDREFAYGAAFTDFRDATADNYASDISYEFIPGLTIRSVTGYGETETVIKTPAGAAFVRDGDHTDGKDFTQDITLEIDNRGNGLSGVVGLFYGSFQRDNLSNQTANLGYFFGGPDNFVPYYNGTFSAETTSIAAYADLRYRWDRWAFLAGGRLLRDTVETDEVSTLLDTETFTYVFADEHNKATFNEFLPKLGITYDLTDNQTVGFTFNKGIAPASSGAARITLSRLSRQSISMRMKFPIARTG